MQNSQDKMGKTIVSPKNLLNRKTKLRLTGDLSLKWNEEGQLFAQASMNRNSIRLSADVIPLLDQFKLFTEQGKAIERYLSRYSDRKWKKPYQSWFAVAS
ncbi:MAG: hypothetical protein HYU64_08075 [Armatimonadetes bacterium]|nr:hypothetical protein [Armatimonadota bacterium]